MHDFLSLVLVINFEGKEIFWSSELEFGGLALLVLLDNNSISGWEILLFSSHDLDEFFEVLDFFWHLIKLFLNNIKTRSRKPISNVFFISDP